MNSKAATNIRNDLLCGQRCNRGLRGVGHTVHRCKVNGDSVIPQRRRQRGNFKSEGLVVIRIIRTPTKVQRGVCSGIGSNWTWCCARTQDCPFKTATSTRVVLASRVARSGCPTTAGRSHHLVSCRRIGAGYWLEMRWLAGEARRGGRIGQGLVSCTKHFSRLRHLSLPSNQQDTRNLL